MIDHQSNRLGLNFLQWRIYLIPDYSETESVFVFKIHHSVADGIALILMMFSLTDQPKVEDYPSIMVRFGWLKNILIHLCMPFLLPYGIIKSKATTAVERNGLKTDESVKKLNAVKKV